MGKKGKKNWNRNLATISCKMQVSIFFNTQKYAIYPHFGLILWFFVGKILNLN